MRRCVRTGDGGLSVPCVVRVAAFTAADENPNARLAAISRVSVFTGSFAIVATDVVLEIRGAGMDACARDARTAVARRSVSTFAARRSAVSASGTGSAPTGGGFPRAANVQVADSAFIAAGKSAVVAARAVLEFPTVPVPTSLALVPTCCQRVASRDESQCCRRKMPLCSVPQAPTTPVK